jgi:hypothetical protein
VADLGAGELRTEALGNLGRTLYRGLRHQHDELLAAEARAEIGRVQTLPKAERRDLERCIAGGVAISVVDLLERVEIGDDDAEPALVAVGPGYFLGRGDEEAVPVGEPGQRVLAGDPVELGIGPAELAMGSDAAKSFTVLPKRWIVERTIAWLNRCRRLAKDWECFNRKALAFLRLASIRLMLRKLC